MSALSALRKPITEIIKRHAGDAAFYWNQWDKAKYSFVIDAERLAHIEYLLIAHLDGLFEANDIGWQEAFANFKRWKGAGESFVCCLLAMHIDSQERFRLLWPIVEQNANDCTRGFISALIWYCQRTPRPTHWLDHWLQTADSSLLKTVSLRASVHLGVVPIDLLISTAQSENHHLRAAVCRTLALHTQDTSATALLQQLLNDPVITVTAEAAIASLNQTQSNPAKAAAVKKLWLAIAQTLPELPTLKGSKFRTTQRRIKRWIFNWSFHSQPNDSQFLSALTQLPPLLQIEAIGSHGSTALCTQLIEMMNTLETAPAALAQFELLTGCDAENTGLTKAVNAEQLITAEHLPPEYHGMPFPNVTAVKTWWAVHAHKYSPHTKVLLGQPLNNSDAAKTFCDALITHAPQHIKRIAQYHTKLRTTAV